MPSQPSFVVTRPPSHAPSVKSGGTPAASTSRPIKRAAAFDVESDNEEDDDAQHIHRSERRPHQRGGAAADGLNGTTTSDRGSSRNRPEFLTDFVAGQTGGSGSGSSSNRHDNKPELTIPLESDLNWRELRSKSSAVAAAANPSLSADERARQALLDEMRGDHAGADSGAANPHSNLVISMSEEDALRMDLGARPDAPDAAAYEAVPVEAFGAAMLRGMGWKEGMGAGRRRNGPQQAPEVQKRSALLGLGAKERPTAEGTGGGSSSKSGGGLREKPKNSRPDMRYVPVVKREQEPGGVSSSRDTSKPASGTSTPSHRHERERERERDRSPRARHERDSRHHDRERDRDQDRKRSYRDYDDRQSDRGSRREEREREPRDRTEGGREHGRERDRDRHRREGGHGSHRASGDHRREREFADRDRR
ncbi:unnamed protein product [Tilletia laevis]|uniref:G-patch domain-containing protein n=2 Tax=Tilletia TaxID=13289 RepID=A0A8X7MT97_9BASI|nr:hypothetical protein CF336_g4188 [Tilletia laevis]KAE8248185.1 hypothetical protein A4X06_0g3899 [Tilletia controversa]KAE8261109.1 hypothetical protein A4X03_0g3538 [Tilletia caries]CAD6886376.1 unnamed protein product [Tilletia caries]CAD6916408.1 unnamed protein product [Tilletia laevis]